MRRDGAARVGRDKAELAALKLGVDAREASEGVSAEARKAARYCMYRKYVGEHSGVVDRGKRIRLAPCVVEAIRDSFREPGCLCATAFGGAAVLVHEPRVYGPPHRE